MASIRRDCARFVPVLFTRIPADKGDTQMKRLILATIVLGLGIVTVFAQSKAVKKSPLEGVWQLVDRTDKDGKKLNPGSQAIRMFTGKHYSSFMLYPNNRPALSSLDTATDSVKVAYLTSSGAQVGTYEMKGNEVICHPAMSARPLADKFWVAYEVKIVIVYRVTSRSRCCADSHSG
jgi:hypothetical protein